MRITPRFSVLALMYVHIECLCKWVHLYVLESTYIKGRLLQQRSSYAIDVSVVTETTYHSNESLKGTQLMMITTHFNVLPSMYAPI